MPGFDGSGPLGQGSMTGRTMGRCNSTSPGTKTEAAFYGCGRGMACRRGFGSRGASSGRGMGRGAGFSQGNAAPFTPVPQTDKNEPLKAQASQLQSSLQRIEQRLNELEKKA
jgi:Family of unknown function (DUF5320)